ncbi:MAG: hypothetical protein H5U37_05620, partial [Caldisericia bacterium]|nr:hypothetical protein [Caldisericia bacterium]
MESYESPTIEQVGGVESDPKSVFPIVDTQLVVFVQAAAIVQVAALAFAVLYKVVFYTDNN